MHPGVVAGVVAGVLSGASSTVHAVLTGAWASVITRLRRG
jgi:hypothetical protein